MLSPEERLEQLEKVLQELEDLSESEPVVVEGARDVEALRKMGITKNVMPLNKGIPVFTFCEELSKRSKKAIVLTDWDRRGGKLARMLKEGCVANGIKVNDRIRTQIVILSKKEIMDIESVPTFLERLRAKATGQVVPNRVKGKRI